MTYHCANVCAEAFEISVGSTLKEQYTFLVWESCVSFITVLVNRISTNCFTWNVLKITLRNYIALLFINANIIGSPIPPYISAPKLDSQ